MIPLYKLEKLPRTQKLRKIAKVFSMAENRLSLSAGKGAEIFTNAEFVFFADASKMLFGDNLFPAEACNIFKEAIDVFKNAGNSGASSSGDSTANIDSALLRRALNNIKHILLAETGKDQADWDFIGSDGRLNPEKRKIFEGMHVYLEDIRSPFNIGAMFRTAESFGVEKIFLSPFSADPHHTRAERTAMGCIDIIPWERFELCSSERASQNIFALETGGVPISEFKFPRQGILIAGSEELGVSPNALAAADASLGRVSIPCYGTKASLNVSVAFGIAIQMWAQALASR